MHQLDVKFAFLNGSLKEYVRVLQPLEFELEGQEANFQIKRKVLYILKQSQRAWNLRIDVFMLQLEFLKCTHKFTQRGTHNLIIVCLYVDDLLIIENHERLMPLRGVAEWN